MLAMPNDENSFAEKLIASRVQIPSRARAMWKGNSAQRSV